MRPDGVRVPKPERVQRVLPSHLVRGALNVVVFGPGRGEAIVVVLPNDDVGVIDGCREPTADPDKGLGDPVREFLDALEREFIALGKPFKLRFVCLTHPHEDHFAGLGRLLKAYRGKVQAVWSVPPVGDRYAESLRNYVARSRGGRDPMPDDMDIKGLERVIAEIAEAHERQGTQLVHLAQQKPLYQGWAQRRALHIVACGPADVDVTNAHYALIEGIETLAQDEDLRARFDPNATSGALHIRWGTKAGVLLGGDLICESGRYRGWHLVEQHVQGPVQIVKVAHHASHEAHHQGLWQRLSPMLAIVTPFKSATGSQPPRPDQIAHLAKGAVVAVTSPPDWPRSANNPLPQYPTAKPDAASSLLPRSRNAGLPMHPTPGGTDTLNAVAVALDEKGQLKSFVLAGKADVYEPP
jgi:hypothetical protein